MFACVDMQQLFGPGSPWVMPWLEKVLPAIEELCAQHPERTIFTRFLPPMRAEERYRTWLRYCRCWASVTIGETGPDTITLVPALEKFVPPDKIFDKIVSCNGARHSIKDFESFLSLTHCVVRQTPHMTPGWNFTSPALASSSKLPASRKSCFWRQQSRVRNEVLKATLCTSRQGGLLS